MWLPPHAFFRVSKNPQIVKKQSIVGADAYIGPKEPSPVVVPDKIFGLTLILDFIDHCHSLPSLSLPLAALGALPLGRRWQKSLIFDG